MEDAGDGTTGRGTLTREVAEFALRLRHQVIHRRLLEELAHRAGANLHDSAVMALLLIEDAGPLRPSDLSEQLGVTLPAMSRTLNRMVGDGLLERTIGRTDLRSVHFTASEAGRRPFMWSVMFGAPEPEMKVSTPSS